MKEFIESLASKKKCGFHDSNIGMLAVVECPKCFEKWSFHARTYDGKGGHYSYFLRFVKEGMNKHFKE